MIRVPQRNPVIESLWHRMDRDFAEQIAATPKPEKPEPMPCVWPTGKHLWSIPEASGRQTCLWCPAVQNATPVAVWPEDEEREL